MNTFAIGEKESFIDVKNVHSSNRWFFFCANILSIKYDNKHCNQAKINDDTQNVNAHFVFSLMISFPCEKH